MSSSQKKMATFEDLSPEQQRVVSEWGKGLAVMAGAGSGKTTTLVIKCAELLKKNPEAQFAAVSFTEKSASDLRAKLTQRLSVEGKSANESEVLKGHCVTTIHGLCASVLREFPREAGFDGEESMLSEGESQRFWERAIEQLWADQTPLEVEQALEKLLNRESRSTLTDLLRRTRDLYAVGVLDSLRDNGDEASVALAVLSEFVVERYDRLKRRRGALDFNDLERGADRALEHAHVRAAFQKRFQLVLVDEFQDTNPLQAKIILRFVKPDFSNLCVVGDPKQSIYRFRDADVSVFEEFCAKLPIKISLTWNFRSRPGILNLRTRFVAGRLSLRKPCRCSTSL
jgi:DNA helicase-2/ATP-dependent DNA helicase PcrA